MNATLVTITKPDNLGELRKCLASFREMAKDKAFPWLVITESWNRAEVMEAAGAETVITMSSLHEGIEGVQTGYNRQRLAKLYAHRVSPNNALIYVDDDVIARKPWELGTFFDTETGSPYIYFQRCASHPWRLGTSEAFATMNAEKRFQLALPFAYTKTYAEALVESLPMQRAWTAYRRGRSAISDFELMGNFAFNALGQKFNHHPIFRNEDKEKSHWTISQGIFEDFQGRRLALR
jgi:hypothetical protein